jgi:hypothetical protein
MIIPVKPQTLILVNIAGIKGIKELGFQKGD